MADAPNSPPRRYRYPFKELTIEGITIGSPQIDLYKDAKECRATSPYDFPAGFQACYGASDLELGLSELRQLHVYFAFKEKKIYLTAASAGLAKDHPPGAPAQLGKPK